MRALRFLWFPEARAALTQRQSSGFRKVTRIYSFLHEVTDWAVSRADVLGLAIVGSHALGTPDQDSDVDLVLLCESPDTLLANTHWASNFGEVCEVSREDYGALVALRVFYKDGTEVEFGLTAMEWAKIPLDAGTKRVISGGVRILYDPERVLRDAEIASAA